MRVVGLMAQRPVSAYPGAQGSNPLPSSSPAPGASSSHVRDLSPEALGECVYGVDEHRPRVLAATSLCGVVFSQGTSNDICICVYALHYAMYMLVS